jgi:hypothetical protein
LFTGCSINVSFKKLVEIEEADVEVELDQEEVKSPVLQSSVEVNTPENHVDPEEEKCRETLQKAWKEFLDRYGDKIYVHDDSTTMNGTNEFYKSQKKHRKMRR